MIPVVPACSTNREIYFKSGWLHLCDRAVGLARMAGQQADSKEASEKPFLMTDKSSNLNKTFVTSN